MGELHSFVVTQAQEIFDLPNIVHHTAICKRYTLNEDRVLKPEYILGTRRFVDIKTHIFVGQKYARWTEFSKVWGPTDAGLNSIFHDVDGELKDKYTRSISYYLDKNFGTRYKLLDFAEKNWDTVEPRCEKFMKPWSRSLVKNRITLSKFKQYIENNEYVNDVWAQVPLK